LRNTNPEGNIGVSDYGIKNPGRLLLKPAKQHPFTYTKNVLMKTIIRIATITLLMFTLAGRIQAGTRIALEYCSETGDIKGTVKDENHQPIPSALVIVLGTGSGTATAEDGSFTIHSINPGSYDLKATALGKQELIKTGVTIRPNETAYLDFTLQQVTIGVVIITAKKEAYMEPIVSKVYSTITTISSQLAQELGTMSISDKITAVCSSCGLTSDNQLVMRGARPGTIEYIIDGEKAFGTTQAPNLAVQQISILSGGIPAEYGDLTGGIIIISTKDYISGMRESKVMRGIILENAEQ
jgi:hypothetical protein